MSNNILVSIIIPCFNKEKTVGKTLDSLIKQTVVKHLEIICIDDCSTDNTVKVLLKYKKMCNDSKICHFHVIRNNKNSSVFATRTLGFYYSNGLYIGTVDPDDWVEPTYFEDFLIGAVKENPYHDISMNSKGNIIEPQLPTPSKGQPLLIEQLYGKNYDQYLIQNKEDLYDIVYTYNILKWYGPDKIYKGKDSDWSNVKAGAYDVDINNEKFKKIITANWNTMVNRLIKADIVHRFYFPNLYINLFEDIVFTWMIFPDCKTLSAIYSRSGYVYDVSDEVIHLTNTSDGSPKHGNYTVTGFLLVSDYLYENNLYDWVVAWKEYRKGFIEGLAPLYTKLFNMSNKPITIPQQNKDWIGKELFSSKYNIASNKSLTKKDLYPEYIKVKKLVEYFTMCDDDKKQFI